MAPPVAMVVVVVVVAQLLNGVNVVDRAGQAQQGV